MEDVWVQAQLPLEEDADGALAELGEAMARMAWLCGEFSRRGYIPVSVLCGASYVACSARGTRPFIEPEHDLKGEQDG